MNTMVIRTIDFSLVSRTLAIIPVAGVTSTIKSIINFTPKDFLTDYLDSKLTVIGSAISNRFFPLLDNISMIALCCTLLLTMFDIEPAKKWTWYIIGGYVVIQFLRFAPL